MTGIKLDNLGEIMALGVLFEEGSRCRPCVVVGVAGTHPDQAERIWVGELFRNHRSAFKHGRREFYRLFFERYGFRHPEDPKATPGAVLPASVIVSNRFDDDGMKAGLIAHTYDPDAPSPSDTKH